MRVQNAFRILAAVKALSLAAIPGVAFAGGSVTATAPASVIILAPVTIAATQGLDFGSVTKPARRRVRSPWDAGCGGGFRPLALCRAR